VSIPTAQVHVTLPDCFGVVIASDEPGRYLGSDLFSDLSFELYPDRRTNTPLDLPSVGIRALEPAHQSPSLRIADVSFIPDYGPISAVASRPLRHFSTTSM
jgi:hypothetical protein